MFSLPMYALDATAPVRDCEAGFWSTIFLDEKLQIFMILIYIVLRDVVSTKLLIYNTCRNCPKWKL